MIKKLKLTLKWESLSDREVELICNWLSIVPVSPKLD